MTEPYIVTLSGARISKTSGIPSIWDIANNHCRTPMFAGATRLPYSVAHHCVAAAELAQEARFSRNGPLAVAYFTLLHEAEVVAYGDVPGPVKCNEQRLNERGLRQRLFDDLSTPLPDGLWDLVEFYDKVEQAAAASWAGLAETVHDPVWASAPHDLKTKAIIVTKNIWNTFPPRDQLEMNSPLAAEFVRRYTQYSKSDLNL